MPWNTNIALMIGGAGSFVIDYDVTDFTLSTPDYNVFDVIGAPQIPVILTINITNSSDLGSLVIDNRFNAASVFTINLSGGSRCVGRGGGGGRGGEAENEPGTEFQIPGSPGFDGLSSLRSAFDFNLDMDDGFCMGGGGGGGGGGVSPGFGGGGGGGGGQGFNNAAGGGGQGVVTREGEAGSLTAAGAGGTGSGSGKDGGDGGTWGVGGLNGGTPLQGNGGGAGVAIAGIFNAITVTLTGVKSEATLIIENRLIGGTSSVTFV